MGDVWYVFGKMEERDLFLWNVLVGGYVKFGFFEEVLNLYYRMLWVGIRFDEYIFFCILRICGGVSDWERGREVYVYVIRYGFEFNIDVVNVLIIMYVKCGDIFSVRLLFDRMFKRDRIFWNVMILGCLENGECMEGLRLFFTMREFGINSDLMTMISVVLVCNFMGDEKLGREIYGYVIIFGFVVEVLVCNLLM